MQAVVSVEDAAPTDTAERMIDYAEAVTSQTLSYGPGVELTEAPGNLSHKLGQGGKSGRVGAVLWRMRGNVSETEPVWCWREPGFERARLWANEIYCYVDRDRDGKFETAYEIEEGGWVSRLGTQARIVPHTVKPFGYRPVAGPGAPPEKLILRYMGPVRAMVDFAGNVDQGLIQFQVTAGTSNADPIVLQTVTVRIVNGRGRFSTHYGHDVEVERVSIEGQAWIRTLAAPPIGDTWLWPDPKATGGAKS